MANDASERSPTAIAERLVAARREARPLASFPGVIPGDLDSAYACQDAGMALWGDAIAGWKVGLIAADLASGYGADRLTGPIFRGSLQRSSPGVSTPFPVFVGGFAAVEAEFVLTLGHDAPPGKTEWTHAEAFETVRSVRVGVETAGSPLAAINDLGPAAIASDFGNNAGLILGAELPGWRTRPVEEWRCESFIDGERVGSGNASLLPGGPFESLRFVLGLNARRGRPLRAGDLVSCGAVTGVHTIRAGQAARVTFDGAGDILCHAEAHTGALTGAHERRR